MKAGDRILVRAELAGRPYIREATVWRHATYFVVAHSRPAIVLAPADNGLLWVLADAGPEVDAFKAAAAL